MGFGCTSFKFGAVGDRTAGGGNIKSTRGKPEGGGKAPGAAGGGPSGAEDRIVSIASNDSAALELPSEAEELFRVGLLWLLLGVVVMVVATFYDGDPSASIGCVEKVPHGP